MPKTKVVLINPISTALINSPKLGLGFIAHSLELAGYKVYIIDGSSTFGGYTISRLYNEVKEIGPDVIGFSFSTVSIPWVYKQIKSLKGLAKITIAGGSHPTILPEEVLSNGADVVVVGEGEDTFVDFLNTWVEGGDWMDVKGICFRKGKEVINNLGRPLIHDLDGYKVARHLVNYEYYTPRKGTLRLFENIITSRGCPSQCTFCSTITMGRKMVRLRSAESVIEEILELTKNPDFKYIRISDDTFTWDKKRTMKICELLLEEVGNSIKWSCVTRPNKVDFDLLLLMKESGCFEVTYGLESFSQETLKRIKKGINVERAVCAARETKKAGMNTKLNMMQGWPWERPEDVDITIQYIKDLAKEGIRFSTRAMLTPFPGTDIYREYNQEYEFTDWWLKEKAGDIHRIYNPPWFMSGYVGTYYDDPILKENYFKYSSIMKRKYDNLMNCKAESYKGDKERGFVIEMLLKCLYLFSKYLFKLNPYLEIAIFKALRKIALVTRTTKYIRL